jgi:hypothetical protein
MNFLLKMQSNHFFSKPLRNIQKFLLLEMGISFKNLMESVINHFDFLVIKTVHFK